MEGGVIAGIAVGCVVFVAICVFVALLLLRLYCQGRKNRVKRRRGKNYFASAQSQIRKKDGSIEAVHVKRVTKSYPINPAGDPNCIKTSQINQPPAGDVFILPDPPPPQEPRL